MRGSMPVQTYGPIPRAPMSTAMKSLLIAGAIIAALVYKLSDTLLDLISRATAPKKK
jgi:hypothetical protein